ncbi:MAG: glycosyltransferase family 4 protein, partial [Planctomycetes bacterium]|nr:glycosyltransferase family 4 protein [Planctomycetota bacterium]
GEPRFVHDLAARLAARGFDSLVLAPHAPGAATRERLDNVSVRRFRYAPALWERLCYQGGILANLRASLAARLALPGFLLAFARSIAREAARWRPEIIHAHWAGPPAVFAALVARRRRVPLVVTCHGGDLFSRVPWPAATLRGLALRKADVVTVNSTASLSQLRRLTGGRPPERPVSLIPMGVDTRLFSPRPTPNASAPAPRAETAEDPAPARRRTIFAAGRFVEKKGFHLLIEALARPASWPFGGRDDGGVTLRLAGQGPMEGALRRLAAEHGARVEWLGPLPPARMAQEYRAADLVAVPSLAAADGDAEGQNLVAVEAMASGALVVASAHAGLRDAIVDGETALAVPPGDVDALRAALVRGLLAREAEDRGVSGAAARMRAGGRALALARYSWDAIAARFAARFDRLLAGRKEER